MKRRLCIYLILFMLLLSGCRSVSGTIQTDGITRAATEEERRRIALAAGQQMETSGQVLSSLPERWKATFSLNNGAVYDCNATVTGGRTTDCIAFELVENTYNSELLKHTLMGDRAEQAILVDDPSAEGQRYWRIVDSVNGQERETLQYYVYGGNVPDLLNYRHDMMIYDDQNREIYTNDALPMITDNEAIAIAAKVFAELGYSGMTVLDGYNYQTEVTFYALLQYTALPVITDSESASAIRMKVSVCNGSVSELCGDGAFREITNRQEISTLMSFEGILALAKAHLEEMEEAAPPVSEITLRHRYVFDTSSNTIRATPVWYFSIPPIEVESAFGIGRRDLSFAIDAVNGTLYGGF